MLVLSNGDIDFYLVDSLPKKLFYNGLKFAMLFSLPQNIKKLEQTSIYIQGTITANQLKILIILLYVLISILFPTPYIGSDIKIALIFFNLMIIYTL